MSDGIGQLCASGTSLNDPKIRLSWIHIQGIAIDSDHAATVRQLVRRYPV
jgi:hypothetical protein